MDDTDHGIGWPGNEWPDPKPDRSATDPESQNNEPGSAVGQIPGKTGGDTYGGLIGNPADQPDDDSEDRPA